MPTLMITSVVMLLSAIIAGYFNIVVFYTLVVAAIVQLLENIQKSINRLDEKIERY